MTTFGGTDRVYKEYYRADYTPIISLKELERVLAGGPGCMIYTLPVNIKSYKPALYDALQQRGREVARFKGTILNGDIVVLRLQ
jgi:hypothetical protein